MLLLVATSIFSLASIFFLPGEPNHSTNDAIIVGYIDVDGNNIHLEHRGGESLPLNSEIILKIPDKEIKTITAESYIDIGDTDDDSWDIGERFRFNLLSDGTGWFEETDLLEPVEVTVIDSEYNAIVWSGILKADGLATWSNEDNYWPMFHHDVMHTGFQSGTGEITDVTVDDKWSYTLSGEVWSSPSVGDVDGDGEVEIIFGTKGGGSGRLICLNADGTFVWSYIIGTSIYSSPALKDVDGDGDLEIFFASDNGFVYCLKVEDNEGQLDWSYRATTSTVWSFKSSPVVGDIDGDGDFEVVIGVPSPGDNVICLDAKGHIDALTTDLLWSYSSAAGIKVQSSPALYDVDGDGDFEVIVAGINSESGAGSGFVYCLDAPSEGGGSFDLIWSKVVDGPVYSSPVIGDVDDNGDMELIVCTTKYGESDRGVVYCFDFDSDSCTEKWSDTTWGPINPIYSTPALADIEGDSKLEIIFGSYTDDLICLDSDGNEVWKDDSFNYASYSSPVIGDIDGDTDLEVLACSYYPGISSGFINSLFDNDGDDVPDNEWDFFVGEVTSSPALADVDDDGFLEVIVAGTGPVSGTAIVYCLDSEGTNSAPNPPYNPSPSDGAEDICLTCPLSVFVSDPDGDSMDVTFYNASDDSVIGTDTSVPSGGIASINNWGPFNLGTTYSWYAVANDGVLDSSPSSTWSFTTISVIKFVADSDIDIAGDKEPTSFIQTRTSNNNDERIREVRAGPRSLLQHKWTIEVTGGLSSYTFYLEAFHTANEENDNFRFSYSTDNSTFINMLTVTKTSPDNTYQTYELPSTISGTIYIRVLDTDRTSGYTNLDTISIDHMYIDGRSY
jgi:hypothetical protein